MEPMQVVAMLDVVVVACVDCRKRLCLGVQASSEKLGRFCRAFASVTRNAPDFHPHFSVHICSPRTDSRGRAAAYQ